MLKNLIGLRALVLVGLGTFIIAGLCILPGCGSDSKPGAAVKNQKVAKSVGKSSPVAIPTLVGNSTGTVKRTPPADNVEVIPGLTQAELNARMAADQKKFEAFQKTGEAAPGMKMTEAEVQAKMAAEQKKYEAFQKTGEAAPGMKMTEAEVQAKMAAEQKKYEAFQKAGEAVPGLKMSEAEVEERMAAERKIHQGQQ